MPGRVILACEMIEDEVRLALEALPPEDRPPLVWMESGLHDRPERLQAALGGLIRAARRRCRDRPACRRALGAPGQGPGRRAPRGSHRRPGRGGPSRARLLRQRAQGPVGAEHLTPGRSRAWTTASRCCSTRLRPRGDPAEPAVLLPHQGLVQPRELDDAGLSTSGTSATAASGPPSCGATMYAGYEQVNLIDTQAYEVEECLDQSREVADRLEVGARGGPGLGTAARAAVQRGEGQRDRRRPARGEDQLQPPVRRKGSIEVETRVLSATREVIIGGGRPTVLIGERINPTGKKRLAEALRAGDLSVVREEALAQVAAGADILDVNVGATGVDEIDMLPRAVEAVAEVSSTCLCASTAARSKPSRRRSPSVRVGRSSTRSPAKRHPFRRSCRW